MAHAPGIAHRHPLPDRAARHFFSGRNPAGHDRLWTCPPRGVSAGPDGTACGDVGPATFPMRRMSRSRQARCPCCASMNGWHPVPAGVEITNTDALPVAGRPDSHFEFAGRRRGSTPSPRTALIAPGGFLARHSPATRCFPLPLPDRAPLTLLEAETVIDSVQFSRAVPGSSEGRNAAGQIQFFPRRLPAPPMEQVLPRLWTHGSSFHGATAGTGGRRRLPLPSPVRHGHAAPRRQVCHPPALFPRAHDGSIISFQPPGRTGPILITW